MEFRFSLAPIFSNSIVKINSNLLPANFRGDRRQALETTTKISEIINTMGEHSAKAQELNRPVTTAQKLRMSDHNLYLFVDTNAGKNGLVLGILKVGKKTLYVFDENGETQKIDAPCVLDFYIQESRQRSGLGKLLFEAMLKEEKITPQKLAIDRPSDKLLGFLQKHYGLRKNIPQMNNFVIYEGFFDQIPNNDDDENKHQQTNNQTDIGASPNTALFGPQFGTEEFHRKKQQPLTSNIPTIQNCPVGRYAAPRPACSMAETNNYQNPHQHQFINHQNQDQNGLSEDPQHITFVPISQTPYVAAAGKPSGLPEDPQRAAFVHSIKTPYIHAAGKPSGLTNEGDHFQNYASGVPQMNNNASLSQSHPLIYKNAANMLPAGIPSNRKDLSQTKFLSHSSPMLFEASTQSNVQNRTSGRLKCDGLTSDSQQSKKIDVSKLRPAGKPSIIHSTATPATGESKRDSY